MADEADVAAWMVDELDKSGLLYQEVAVYEIADRFGEEFTYYNESGNPAISRKVLREFRKRTPNVVWERGERCWRARTEGDPEGRQDW